MSQTSQQHATINNIRYTIVDVRKGPVREVCIAGIDHSGIVHRASLTIGHASQSAWMTMENGAEHMVDYDTAKNATSVGCAILIEKNLF